MSDGVGLREPSLGGEQAGGSLERRYRAGQIPAAAALFGQMQRDVAVAGRVIEDELVEAR